MLTDDHILTPHVRDTVREAVSRGAEIVLCTGRGPINALPVLDELGLSGTLITHNGAATIEAEKREVLHQYRIDSNEVERYREFCMRNGYHFDMNTAFEMMIEGQRQKPKRCITVMRPSPFGENRALRYQRVL